jgi:hypothetical protein
LRHRHTHVPRSTRIRSVGLAHKPGDFADASRWIRPALGDRGLAMKLAAQRPPGPRRSRCRHSGPTGMVDALRLSTLPDCGCRVDKARARWLAIGRRRPPRRIHRRRAGLASGTPGRGGWWMRCAYPPYRSVLWIRSIGVFLSQASRFNPNALAYCISRDVRKCKVAPFRSVIVQALSNILISTTG